MVARSPFNQLNQLEVRQNGRPIPNSTGSHPTKNHQKPDTSLPPRILIWHYENGGFNGKTHRKTIGKMEVYPVVYYHADLATSETPKQNCQKLSVVAWRSEVICRSSARVRNPTPAAFSGFRPRSNFS